MAAGAQRNPLSIFTPHCDEQARFLQAQTPIVAAFCGNQCLVGSTLVRMADGSARRIDEVLPGESVAGVALDGTTAPALVVAVHDNGTRPVSRYTFSKGGQAVSVVATPDHKMLARPARGRNRIVQAGRMRRGWLAQMAQDSPQNYSEFAGVEPLPAQATYDLTIDNDTHLFALANGLVVSNSGKSTIGAVMALVQLLPDELVPAHLKEFKRFRGPVHGWALCPTEDKIFDSLLPALMKWCPPESLKGGSRARAFNGERMLLTFANGSTLGFKCFRGDQRALRPDGTWTPVKELLEGDSVQTRYGPRKVTGTVEYPDAPMIRVRTRGGHDIVATPNHKHMTQRGWVRADALKLTDELETAPVMSPGDRPMEEWELGWLAILLGDGCLTGSQNTVFFSQRDDSPLMDELPPLPPGCRMRRAATKGSAANFFLPLIQGRRDNPLMELVRQMGLLGATSHTKFVPQRVFRAPTEQRAAFLRWLWGCDGTYSPDKRVAVYTTVSPQLADDVKRMLWSLGLRAVLTNATARCNGREFPFIQVRVSKADFGGFARLVGKAGHPRINAVDSRPRYKAGAIRSIEAVPNAPAYCVEVEEVHELIVDGVVTSNTYKQDASTLGGATLHFIWYDEPPPRGHRDEAATRLLATGGPEWYTMTPLKANAGWIRRDIWRKREHPDITVCKWSMHDNPALDKTKVKQLLESYKNDLWRRAREFGDFMDVAGLVYADIERCVIPDKRPRLEQMKSWDHVWGIDPGIRNAAVICGGFDSHGVDWIYDEHLIQNGTPSQYAQAIDILLAKYGLRRSSVMFVIDPAARQRSQATGDTVQSELSRLGIHTINGANDREAGQQQIRDRILHGRLKIYANCVGLRDDADEFAWEMDDEDDSIGPADDSPFHRLATLRYQVMVRPFFPQREETALERNLGRGVDQALDLRYLQPKRQAAPLGPMM